MVLALMACGGPPPGRDDPRDDGGADAAADAAMAAADAGPTACDEDDDRHAATECGGDDCDDGDPEVHAGATDERVDGRDQDCDGTDGLDADHDGVASESAGGLDCDDADATVHPGAPDGVFFETVDQSAGRPSLALAGDVLRIGYSGWRPITNLPVARVASREDGEWHVEAIEPDLELRVWGPLALDEDRHSHFLTRSNEDGVRHWTDASGAWLSEVVTSPDAAYGFGSFAVDLDGAAHTIYENGEFDIVRATNDSGAWQEHLLVTDGTMYGSAVVIDGDGAVHVAFDSRGQIVYSTDRSGAWDTPELPGQPECAVLPALAVGEGGVAHVAFLNCRDDPYSLWYGANASGAFVVERIESDGVADLPQIAVDPEGFVHLVYGGPFDSLEYLTNRSGAWVGRQIERDAQFPSIAIDADGLVHLAFQTTGYEIRYARFPPPDDRDQDCSGEAW